MVNSVDQGWSREAVGESGVENGSAFCGWAVGTNCGLRSELEVKGLESVALHLGLIFAWDLGLILFVMVGLVIWAFHWVQVTVILVLLVGYGVA